MAAELPYLDADALMSLVSWTEAITALEAALARGAHLTGGPARFGTAEAHGQLLMMPARSADLVGVKLTSVAPGNPALGLPRIQAVYLLFDAATLTPRTLVDGTALTTLRTPAQSALAVRALARKDASTLLVFGSGPQAWGHAHAIGAVRPIQTVRIAGRDQARQAALIDRLRAEGVPAMAGAGADVATADIVVCATTARSPVFDGRLLRKQACVVAVGSHEPAARELDDVVFQRAGRVVVEERSTALREAGDVIQAIASGALNADQLLDLAEVTGAAGNGTVAAAGGISVFKGVGMGWQDLAVAEAADVKRRRGLSDRGLNCR
ncbi:MAG TPA: ornithine cyclodeaminase family protein [Jatrophihabitans sp.]|uniref:ornithine cyclodeaminase family protein n=1 Tax=Jatrophihabitans sp. TaxID=1932789 RepID=UPI002F0164EE